MPRLPDSPTRSALRPGARWPSLSSQRARRALLLIMACAVLLRVGVALYLGDTVPPGKDETSYFTLGTRLATGHGFTFDRGWYPFTPAETPTAHWSFLYTLIIAAVYAVAGPHPLAVRLVSAILSGLLLPWLTYRLAQRLASIPSGPSRNLRPGGSPAQPQIIAAGLAAIYPYFMLYGAMVQTEAFYICALLWSLERALALRWQPTPGQFTIRNLQPALLLGLSLAIATLFRQSILPWVALLFAWLLWTGYRRGSLRRATLAVLISALTLAVLIAPFTFRNYRVYGELLLLNSNAGYAMYSAQHPMHGVSFQEFAAAPLPADLLAQGLNEAQWDRALMERGIRFVLAEPGRYLRLSLSRVFDYFDFWPKATTSLINNLGRIASFGLFLPFMLYGIVVEVRAKARARAESLSFSDSASSSALALLLSFVVFYSLLHIFTWAMPRYRLPVDAVMLVFAAVGFLELAGRAQRRRFFTGAVARRAVTRRAVQNDITGVSRTGAWHSRGMGNSE